MSTEIAGIGIVAAFLAGAISFLSPCVLPLVPGYVSFIAGQTDQAPEQQAEFRARLRAGGLSLCFCAGLFDSFVVLGAGVGVLGRVLLSWRNELSLVGGAIIWLLSIYSAGLGVPFLITALSTHNYPTKCH
ncbi:cytochrome c biogenesis CcdA family protein [Granulosicoccus antarcticus]|uniref:Cytochrome C biogenesis protein transmembrane domain-containing protein n=1 Tax=Granulosicoccus antarcticus IMCC3135 TaxID=1192854 RepID=A0A2Z2NWZ1_9GAMM|nr:cytochrome c biogenesis protein CcdA [Granulosicoccus antarcticus]ASJ73370.1 hypothetical protein IMCC3135_16440 [Granulosicoccus antarcticus IMCC3135]